MTESQITDDSITVKNLIRQKICPPWWVPSKTLLGRCIPSFQTTEDNQPMTNETVIIDSNETPENEVVSGGVLKKAVNYIGKLIDVRSFGERIYSDLATTWWMILLALVLATVLSLVWIVLMRYKWLSLPQSFWQLGLANFLFIPLQIRGRGYGLDFADFVSLVVVRRNCVLLLPLWPTQGQSESGWLIFKWRHVFLLFAHLIVIFDVNMREKGENTLRKELGRFWKVLNDTPFA